MKDFYMHVNKKWNLWWRKIHFIKWHYLANTFVTWLLIKITRKYKYGSFLVMLAGWQLQFFQDEKSAANEAIRNEFNNKPVLKRKLFMDDVLKNDELMKFCTAFPTLASIMPSSIMPRYFRSSACPSVNKREPSRLLYDRTKSSCTSSHSLCMKQFMHKQFETTLLKKYVL